MSAVKRWVNFCAEPSRALSPLAWHHMRNIRDTSVEALGCARCPQALSIEAASFGSLPGRPSKLQGSKTVLLRVRHCTPHSAHAVAAARPIAGSQVWRHIQRCVCARRLY